MAKENQFKRQVAYKVRVKDILEGNYVQKEGWEPSYVTIKGERNISRANIFATAVSPAMNEGNMMSFMVDDGSGKIMVRAFDNSSVSLNGVEVGSVFMVIGRPREFNNEKYLVPDIIRKIDDPAWIKVRELELSILDKKYPDETRVVTEERPVSATEEDVNAESGEETSSEEEASEEQPKKEHLVEENKVEETAPVKEEKKVGSQQIMDIIKELDSGNGADTESVIEKSGDERAEKMINTLLREGEIFEISPGKLKILE